MGDWIPYNAKCFRHITYDVKTCHGSVFVGMIHNGDAFHNMSGIGKQIVKDSDVVSVRPCDYDWKEFHGRDSVDAAEYWSELMYKSQIEKEQENAKTACR